MLSKEEFEHCLRIYSDSKRQNSPEEQLIYQLLLHIKILEEKLVKEKAEKPTRKIRKLADPLE